MIQDFTVYQYIIKLFWTKVFFLPLSNTILTIFKDDTIHGWEVDTLEYKYQVGVIGETVQHFRSFATTQDGRLLVAGGR